MKKLAVLCILCLLLTGCQANKAPSSDVKIELQDSGITVDGTAIGSDTSLAVYAANDIVYYPTGQDHTFGEGTEADAHEASEAEGHTVVHITKAGTYSLSGSLSAGQIAVDLGEDARDDPNAVATLVLDGVDIQCSVAPAVIFYNVYECSNGNQPTQTVDTSHAGANVYVGDDTVNNISGSYVARIYEPGTVELSEDGTEVLDAKKLHKYDAAFYSKMSMNIDGDDGILNIKAENEGLDSELHLTINGGNIRILSGNDGINTNEDGVSVTTVNGGTLDIQVTGETGEGDGIDSNGWLVINGGAVSASACAFSGDAGIDSDMGIYLNGGTVMASGHMLDRIAGGEQNYAVFTFAETQKGGTAYTLKNSSGKDVLTCAPVNDFSVLILAGDLIKAGEHTLWMGETQLSASAGRGFDGGRMPGGREFSDGERPEMPEGMTPPKGMEFPEGERPQPPEGMAFPEGEPPQMPEGMQPPQGGQGFGRPDFEMGEASTTFEIRDGGNYFSFVKPQTE